MKLDYKKQLKNVSNREWAFLAAGVFVGFFIVLLITYWYITLGVAVIYLAYKYKQRRDKDDRT